MGTESDPFPFQQELRAGWEVETCLRLPHNADHSEALWAYHDCGTWNEAIAVARLLLAISKSGSVRITPFADDGSSAGRQYTNHSIFLTSQRRHGRQYNA